MSRKSKYFTAIIAIPVLLYFAGHFTINAFSFGKSPANEAHPFRDGDIIFQTSKSGQSLAISYATHSQYTHCGLLFQDEGKWYVYEAVGPVKKTLFKQWISVGDSSFYVVRRLAKADSILTPVATKSMRTSVNKRMGTGYDFWFGWNDSLIYCSELVWKAYHESTGLDVGTPKPMREYDLTNPLVIQTMNQRYGPNIPYDTLMISPGDIYDSPMLITVTQGIK